MERRSCAWTLVSLLVACGGEGKYSLEAPLGGTAQVQAGQAGQVGGGGLLTAAGSATGGTTGGATGGASAAGMGGHSGGVGGTGGGSGASSGGAGSGGMVTTPEALVPIAEAFCAAAQSCCAKELLPTMLDDCESGYGTRHEVAAALARGTVTLDAAGLERCLAAYRGATETCEQLDVRAACRGVVHGTRADGEPCVNGAECAGNEARACLLADSLPTTVGVCKKIRHGQVDDACSITCRPDESCTWTTYGATSAEAPVVCFEAEGVYCDRSEDTSKCRAIRPEGAECTESDQCGSAGHCDFDTRTCKRLGQLNDPCGMCIPQLSCIDGTCKSPSFTSGPTCDGISYGPY